MFGYYFSLALRSFRRNKVLTTLMVLAIALGIGASMTTLTVYHVLSGDPIPQKSSQLYYVQMDPATMDGFTAGEEPQRQMTRFDSEALLREKKASRQAVMSGGSASIMPPGSGLSPFQVDSRHTSADFFAMFDTPFRFGGGWSATDDDTHARVLVLSAKLNDKLFDGANSVGRMLRIEEHDYRVVGVMDEWRPTPRFYDLNLNNYGEAEQVFLPLSTAIELKLGRNGSMDCWGDIKGDETSPNAPCAWLQYWVELRTAAAADSYRQYLTNYSDEQRRAGRFERPTNVRLRNVMQWMDYNEVVPGDVRLQAWLAFGFLLVCLVNTVGLLLAKFLRRGGEIGVRRALGASRRAIFAQALVEAGTIGLAGGLAGLALAQLGLWATRSLNEDFAAIIHLDFEMLLTTFLLAITASVLAGLLPAWRACQITPAVQLKSQ
jgi:putative ABC transport system permease protein